MGQLYVVANVSRRQFLHPHAFEDGAKLREFGANAGGTLAGLTLLLAPTCSDFYGEDPERLVGSWAYDRIVIVGDYAEETPGDELDPGTIYARCVAASAADDMEASSDADDNASAADLRREAAGWTDISAKVVPLVEQLLRETIPAGAVATVPTNWRPRGDDGPHGAAASEG